MGNVFTCCGCPQSINKMNGSELSEEEAAALVEDDSWKKWSSMNQNKIEMGYEPPKPQYQQAEAGWEL